MLYVLHVLEVLRVLPASGMLTLLLPLHRYHAVGRRPAVVAVLQRVRAVAVAGRDGKPAAPLIDFAAFSGTQ